MTFKGRYWTRDGTLVIVHKVHQGVELLNQGHVISTLPPYETKSHILWDEKGLAKSCTHPPRANFNIHDYDLVRGVNPQSVEASIEVVDCEKCRKEKEEGLGVNIATQLKISHMRMIDDTLVVSDEKILDLDSYERNGPIVVSMAKEIQMWRRLGRELGLFNMQLGDKLKELEKYYGG